VAFRGPPPVITKMFSVALNAPMNAPTKLMMISGFRVGSVMRTTLVRIPAPSTSAASYISSGMDFSAAR